jgi:hypothetical protein
VRPYTIRRIFDVLDDILAYLEIDPFLGAEFQTQVSLGIAGIWRIEPLVRIKTPRDIRTNRNNTHAHCNSVLNACSTTD